MLTINSRYFTEGLQEWTSEAGSAPDSGYSPVHEDVLSVGG